MNKYTKEIKELIEKHNKIAIFHHTLPDGDSMSSSYALLRAIQQTYPDKEVVWLADKEYIKKRFWYLDFNDFKDTVDTLDDSYLTIVGDVSGKDRIYKYEEFAKGKEKIVFDHHKNGPTAEYDLYWHEPTWPASAIQSYFIAKEFVKDWNEELSLLFYFGIMTDTGRFSYSLANPLPLEISAELLKNVSNERISDLYISMDQKTEKSLKFHGWVLNNFKIEDGVAYVKVTTEDQEKLGVTPDDCARPNLIGNIKDVKVWILFIDYPESVRVEFRSTGTPVNEIATQFNGGGHLRAAGCRIENMSRADEVIKATKEAL